MNGEQKATTVCVFIVCATVAFLAFNVRQCGESTAKVRIECVRHYSPSECQRIGYGP